jgi:hypothetical protein
MGAEWGERREKSREGELRTSNAQRPTLNRGIKLAATKPQRRDERREEWAVGFASQPLLVGILRAGGLGCRHEYPRLPQAARPYRIRLLPCLRSARGGARARAVIYLATPALLIMNSPGWVRPDVGTGVLCARLFHAGFQSGGTKLTFDTVF